MNSINNNKDEDDFSITINVKWWMPILFSIFISFWLMLRSFITMMDNYSEALVFPSSLLDWFAIASFVIFAIAFLVILAVGATSFLNKRTTNMN